MNMSVDMTETKSVLLLKPKMLPFVFLFTVYIFTCVALLVAHAHWIIVAFWFFMGTGLLWYSFRIYYAPTSIVHTVEHYSLPAQYVTVKNGVLTVFNMPIRVVLNDDDVTDAEFNIRANKPVFVSRVRSFHAMRDMWVYDTPDSDVVNKMIVSDRNELLNSPDFYLTTVPCEQKTSVVGKKHYTPSHVKYVKQNQTT